MPSIYDLARKRLADTDAVKSHIPKITTRPLSDDEKRKRNREAVRRYSATPKGKENNRKTCRTYYRNHPEKVKDYVKKYKSRFKTKWGVSVSTWLYWKSKLVQGTVKPEEVPERFMELVKRLTTKKDK